MKRRIGITVTAILATALVAVALYREVSVRPASEPPKSIPLPDFKAEAERANESAVKVGAIMGVIIERQCPSCITNADELADKAWAYYCQQRTQMRNEQAR